MLSLRLLLASAIVMATACLPLAGLSGCAAPKPPVVTYHPLPDLEKAGLHQLWERKIPVMPGEKIAHAWRVGDSIYVSTTDANLVRINAAEGTLKWQIDLRNPEYDILRPADVPGGKLVLVLNRGKAFLINKQTGDIVLQKTLSVAVSTDPIIAGDAFCVGGVDYFRAIYIDFLSGQKWDTPATGDVFSANPAVEGSTALLATESGSLWRVNLNDGEWLWKGRKVNGQVVGGLAADGRAVYIPCLDNHVYAFATKDTSDINSGGALWSTLLEGRLDNNLSATRSEVLVLATGKGLYALSTTRGDIKWIAPGVNALGTIVRDRIWVSDTGGNLSAIAMDTGEVITTQPVGAAVIPNNVDQLILLINGSSTVAAYAATK